MNALVRVETRAAYAARLLPSAAPLERELVLGVLRWRLTLDTLLCRHLNRRLEALDPPVRACLRVGLYEAQRLSTPAPVAVAEAVRVAKLSCRQASGLVNAVLRRAAGEPWPAADDESVPLAVRHSQPEWLIERWRTRLGEERLGRSLAAMQEPAPLWLLDTLGVARDLGEGGCALEAHPAVPGVVAVRDGVAAAVAALQAGRAYAIDPHAVVVARLLPRTAGPVADLAAAPGGKALVLALRDPATTLVAGDRSLGRCVMMRRNLRVLVASPAVVAADVERSCLRPRSQAAVLLDAPCSGTGTLRRHPEIRWRLRPASLGELAALQRRLAAAAAELVTPGGYLLYATCSLEPEENEAVVAELPLEPVPIAAAVPAGVEAVELPSGGVLIPPAATGDGFVAHLLRRAG